MAQPAQIPLIDKPVAVLTRARLQAEPFIVIGAPDRARANLTLPRLLCHPSGSEEAAERETARGAAEAPQGERNRQIPVRPAKTGPVPQASVSLGPEPPCR